MFPPGDTRFRQHKRPSAWREFGFALHQLQEAIEPSLGWPATIANGNTLAADLSEPSRKRAPQVAAFFAEESAADPDPI